MKKTRVYPVFLFVFVILSLFLIYSQFFSSEQKISSDPNQAQLVAKARIHLEKDRPNSALQILSLALKKDSTHPETHYLLARAYHRSKQFTLAEQYCLKALNLRQEYPEALKLLTQIRFDVGIRDWQKDKTQSLKNFLYVLRNSSDQDKLEKIAGLTGGKYKLKRLTNDLFPDYAPRFSHDGKKLLFFSDTSYLSEDYGWGEKVIKKSKIFQMDVSGGRKICLTHGDSSVQFPGFSSDDRKIIYEKENPDPERKELVFNYDRDLYIRNLDNGEEIRLTQDHGYDGLASFSPDDKRIVYVSGGSICLMDLEDRKVTSLCRPEGIIIKKEKPIVPYYPSFSPDGSEILFQAGFDKRKIFLMESDGKNLKGLSQIEDEDYFPSFSPDGQKIVFVSQRTGAEELYLMRKDGKNLRQLTFDGMNKKHPCFSGDGKHIAYVAKEKDKPDPYFEIYLLSLNETIPKERLVTRLENLLNKNG